MGVGLAAQTTQGTLSRRNLLDARDGEPVPGSVSALRVASGIERTASASTSGYFAIPLLSPGVFRVRLLAAVSNPELYDLELPVAGAIRLLAKLRPESDPWEQTQTHSVFLPDASVLVFLGPDLDITRRLVHRLKAARR